MAYLNNTLVQLFDTLELNSGVTFASFTTNETSKQNNIINKNQPYMQQYEGTFDNKIYKYLYDPDLSFDFRFHQRLANISYEDKNKPWATVLFNTKQVKPLTNVLSHTYTGTEVNEADAYQYTTKRVLVPVNMVIIANDLTYLYTVTEKIATYFDRIINFKYTEHRDFTETFSKDYKVTGMATNIQQVDLTKLDTQNRGSLVTTAFSFDLVYFVTTIPSAIGLLEKVILEIKVVNQNTPLTISITE